MYLYDILTKLFSQMILSIIYFLPSVIHISVVLLIVIRQKCFRRKVLHRITMPSICNTRLYYILQNDALFLSHLKNSELLFFQGLLLSYALHKEVVKLNILH